ncbi:MAG: hypothetical protein IJ220_07505 [Clostridia bacterium]|nr:hypothetical protein [Clostridia bacterium]
MFGYYNGYSESGAPCQSHLLLHSGYRYKFQKFYELCGETFVEIEGMDNHQNKEANPGFNLKWFSTMPPEFAYSCQKPVPNSKIQIETVNPKHPDDVCIFQIKILEVHQIAMNTYCVFADDYKSYIVQI